MILLLTSRLQYSFQSVSYKYCVSSACFLIILFLLFYPSDAVSKVICNLICNFPSYLFFFVALLLYRQKQKDLLVGLNMLTLFCFVVFVDFVLLCFARFLVYFLFIMVLKAKQHKTETQKTQFLKTLITWSYVFVVYIFHFLNHILMKIIDLNINLFLLLWIWYTIFYSFNNQ